MGRRHPRSTTNCTDAQVRCNYLALLSSRTHLQRWLKQTGLDTPDLGHLKRIRKQDETTTFLLTASPDPPTLPEDLHVLSPYTLSVPTAPALTPLSLRLKSSLWPTLYTPSRKNETEQWLQGKVRWAWEAMKRTVDAANEARTIGQVDLTILPHPHVLMFFEPAPYRCAYTHTLRRQR